MTWEQSLVHSLLVSGEINVRSLVLKLITKKV